MGTHATGDATISAVIDAVAKAGPDVGLRHYVIHGDLVSSPDLRRLATLGMGLNTQPGIRWAVGSAATRFLGRERNLRKQPLLRAIEVGVELALSTDAPVIEPDWRRTITTAMERNLRDEPTYRDDQCLTAQQALRAMTHAGAWQCHEERWRGSVGTGMAADLVILDSQVDWSDPQAVLQAQVDTVLIDGVVVHGDLGRAS